MPSSINVGVMCYRSARPFVTGSGFHSGFHPALQWPPLVTGLSYQSTTQGFSQPSNAHFKRSWYFFLCIWWDNFGPSICFILCPCYIISLAYCWLGFWDGHPSFAGVLLGVPVQSPSILLTLDNPNAPITTLSFLEPSSAPTGLVSVELDASHLAGDAIAAVSVNSRIPWVFVTEK
ncbi:hypothetical protein BGW80DRAFT_453244 [Lactifluus volemus]|nr:hypothetical protein BGW80DRAFT_453244 [Lactifluus volemus]